MKAKYKNQPKTPIIEEWIKKGVYVHKEYFFKREEEWSYVICKEIVISKDNDTEFCNSQKDKYMFPLISVS